MWTRHRLLLVRLLAYVKRQDLRLYLSRKFERLSLSSTTPANLAGLLATWQLTNRLALQKFGVRCCRFLHTRVNFGRASRFLLKNRAWSPRNFPRSIQCSCQQWESQFLRKCGLGRGLTLHGHLTWCAICSRPLWSDNCRHGKNCAWVLELVS